MSALVAARWDGQHFTPLSRFARACDEHYVIGEVYHLEAIDQAQSAQDKAYHCAIKEAWRQLPEDFGAQFPKPDDLRHWLLIETGYCTVTRLAFASSKDAMAALPLLRSDGAQIGVIGAVAVVKRPLSQKIRGGMPKDQRLASYRDTQDLAASLIKVKPDEIARNASEAA